MIDSQTALPTTHNGQSNGLRLPIHLGLCNEALCDFLLEDVLLDELGRGLGCLGLLFVDGQLTDEVDDGGDVSPSGGTDGSSLRAHCGQCLCRRRRSLVLGTARCLCVKEGTRRCESKGQRRPWPVSRVLCLARNFTRRPPLDFLFPPHILETNTPTKLSSSPLSPAPSSSLASSASFRRPSA